jgi:hypothetical protein
MIPVEKKSELLLREDRSKVIIYEFFNTIGHEPKVVVARRWARFAPKAAAERTATTMPRSMRVLNLDGRTSTHDLHLPSRW